MKKKILAFFVVLITMLACVACTGQQQTRPTPVATRTVQVSNTPISVPSKTISPSKTPRVTATATTIADICDTNPVPPELLASPPQVSNHDKLIAFSTQRHSDIDWGYADVYVVRFDGTGLKQLTYNPDDDEGPSWSPDGKKILFYSDRNHLVCPENDRCESELFIMNQDGTDSRKVTPDSSYYPGRSPDGKYIAYTHEFYDPLRLEHGLGDDLSDILVRNISGSYVKNITAQLQPAGFGPIEWSPTGKHFAFSGVTEPIVYIGERYHSDGYWPRNAYLVNADGLGLQKLPDGPFQGYEHTEAWSPDGQRLAFLTAKGIAIVHADGSGLSEYPIEQSFGDRQIFWPADGQYLVFTDAGDLFYRIKPDFTGLERLPLVTEIDKLIYRFQLLESRIIGNYPYKKLLSPDGKWIAYFACSSQIRVINTETRESYFVLGSETLKNFPIEFYPLSIGDDLEWAPDSRQLIFTYNTQYDMIIHTFRELFTINIDGTGLRKIDAGGDVWFPAVQP